jgi:hypothetical protein
VQHGVRLTCRRQRGHHLQKLPFYYALVLQLLQELSAAMYAICSGGHNALSWLLNFLMC